MKTKGTMILVVLVAGIVMGCVGQQQLNPNDIVINNFKWTGTAANQRWEATIVSNNYDGMLLPSTNYPDLSLYLNHEKLPYSSIMGEIRRGEEKLITGSYTAVPDFSGDEKRAEISIVNEKTGKTIDTKIISMPYYSVEVTTQQTIGKDGGYVEIKNTGNTPQSLSFYRGDGNSGAELIIDGSTEGSNGWFILKPYETKRFSVNLNYPSWQPPFVYEGYDANGVKSIHYSVPKEGNKIYILSTTYFDGAGTGREYKLKSFQIQYNIDK